MQGKRIAGYTTAGNDVAKNECDSISINANIHRQNAGKAYARCSLPAFSINARLLRQSRLTCKHKTCRKKGQYTFPNYEGVAYQVTGHFAKYAAL